jgi:hypothetical protein
MAFRLARRTRPALSMRRQSASADAASTRSGPDPDAMSQSAEFSSSHLRQLAQFSGYTPDDPTSWGGIGAIEQPATDRLHRALVATSTRHP